MSIIGAMVVHELRVLKARTAAQKVQNPRRAESTQDLSLGVSNPRSGFPQIPSVLKARGWQLQGF
jgi:hypothetical protein